MNKKMSIQTKFITVSFTLLLVSLVLLGVLSYQRGA